jgi:hypothetical protein
VADDSRAPPLPRRMPGNRQKPGTGPAEPLVLPESVIQGIRDALDSAGEEASPQDPTVPAKRLSSLPRRISSASGHEPPAAAAQPVSSPSLPSSASAEVLTHPLPDRAGGVTEEITVQPDTAAQPEPSTAEPAPPQSVPVQRPERQDRRDEETSGPEKAPAPQKNRQADGGKARVRRTNPLTRPPKPAPPKALAPPSGPSRPQEQAPRNRRMTIGVILAVVLLSAGSLAFVLTRHAATPATRDGYGTGARAEVLAAAWVADQVTQAATVSCDQVMCQALEERGVPAASLLELRTGQADPLHSHVLVSTAAIRRLIGSEVITTDAPAVIASFGSGSMRIEVREIAQRGAAAYSSALNKDIRERKASATSLVDNPRITVSAAARRQLAAGQVDSRLLVVIASLAARRPISILAFGDLGPGASPGIPLRGAYLAGTGGTAASQMQWISAFLQAQSNPYAAAHIHPERLAGSRNVLLIEFAAPSPLGLLG